MVAFPRPTRGRGILAKHDDHWKSTRGHSRIIRDQVWWSLMANLGSRWTYRDQVWPPLTVNSWSSFGAQSPCEGIGWVVTGVVGSLLRGRDASYSALAFQKPSFHFSRTRGVLGSGTPIRIWCFQCLGSTPLIIRVCDISLHLDRDCWFQFLNWLLIPTIDLDSEPLVVDLY